MLRKGLALSLAACLSCAGPSRQSFAVARSTLNPHEAALSSRIGALLDQERAHGYVLVAAHGKPFFSRGYGVADRVTGTVPTADTRFRVYSVSKQFTSVAVLQLVEQGKIGLQDSITKHVPEYTPKHDGSPAVITIHQLLNHTCGVPSFTDDEAFMQTVARPHSREEIFASFKDKPLSFAPGSSFGYSNSGYFLLGLVVERGSGKTFESYLQDHLLGPAGLRRSSTTEGSPDDAVGYKQSERGLADADSVDMGLAFAAGGLRATANDLLAWNRALFASTRLLRASSRATMITPGRAGYGYGIGRMTRGGHDWVTHSGAMFGFSATLTHVLDHDVDIVVLSNSEGFDSQRAATGILKLVLSGNQER